EETARYIDHRLKVAGALAEIFDPAAKREVYRLSGGVPRVINVICDRALLGAYSRESRRVDRRTVRRAAAEVAGQRLTPRALRWIWPAAGLVWGALMGAGAWSALASRDVSPDAEAADTATVPLAQAAEADEGAPAAAPLDAAAAGPQPGLEE